MKDLFVFTADADALAVIRAVLDRPSAIGIRSIACDVDRHTGKDPGMVKNGPELIRMTLKKTEFQNVMLIWDYDGSGDLRSPEQSRAGIQLRLRQVTWEDRSDAVVVVPEIEEWLWHDLSALAHGLSIDVTRLQPHIDSFVAKRNKDFLTCKRTQPKELFEHCLYQVSRRKPLPDDFKRIATSANLARWEESTTFASFMEILRRWFPEA